MFKITLILHFGKSMDVQRLSNFASGLHQLSDQFSFVAVQTREDMIRNKNTPTPTTDVLRHFIGGSTQDEILQSAIDAKKSPHYVVLTHDGEMIHAANKRQIPVLTFGITGVLPFNGAVSSKPENALSLIKDIVAAAARARTLEAA